jgi:hypothetical protein
MVYVRGVLLGDQAMDQNEPLGSHTLTKKFFMSLPAGVYLVSNCYETLGPGLATPAFSEYVAQEEGRKAQWGRIKAVCVDQRLCDVYRSSEDHKGALQSRTAQSLRYPSILICEREQDPGDSEAQP